MLRPQWGSVLLVLAVWSRICCAQNDGDDDDNELGLEAVPSTADFLRRATARGTIIGDYAYFDGGEVSQLVGGKSPSDDRPSNAVNRTLSIDLSQSWKPSNVTIKEITKTSPNLNRQALFTDESSNSFYIWGGHTSWGAPVPQNELWRFTADGSGGGDWTTQIPGNPDVFRDLKRAEGAVFCSTPDSAFQFGGVATMASNGAYFGATPGFVHINFTTQAWSNYTEGPWSAYRTLYAAEAEYIPTFGPNGLVMLIGGETRELGSSRGNRGFLSFQNLTFMDPVTRDFHYQRTTGTAPSGRFYHCSAGVEGKNGTFIYGGRNDRNNEVYDDAYVLTLPGFHWEKVDYEAKSPRSGHACLVVGKRQLLSFGGVNHEPGMPKLWQDPDPWPQGLGVFDMTELNWTNEYDADASDYDSPQVVKSWYADGGLDDVKWSSQEVATLFGKTDGQVEEGGGSDNQDGGGGNGSDSGSDNSSSTPVGAIAGGVVGGIAAIAIVGLIVWFLRRRSKQREAAGVSESHHAGVGGSSPSKTSYMPVSPSAMTPSELDQTQRVEMQDSSPKPELPAAPQYYAAELDGTGVGGQAPQQR
ncbi:hypothetical protein ACHAQA_001405 [Verticillium albo-atrum]